MKNQTKIEQFIEQNQGLVVRYRHQDFVVDFQSKSYLGNGIYATAIENGKVRKGDAQFISWRYLRKYAAAKAAQAA